MRKINANNFICSSTTELNDVFQLFKKKNAQYSGVNDVLRALKEGASRSFGVLSKETAFKYCMQLKDKHDVALLQRGVELEDVKERLHDVIVYSLLALAILSGEDEELQS